MSRAKNPIRWTRLNLSLPEDLRAQVDLALWSDVEGRVPYGAHSELIATLLRGWLSRQPLNPPTQKEPTDVHP